MPGVRALKTSGPGKSPGPPIGPPLIAFADRHAGRLVAMALLDDDDLSVVAITPVMVMFTRLHDDTRVFRTGREGQCKSRRDESGDSNKHKTHVQPPV